MAESGLRIPGPDKIDRAGRGVFPGRLFLFAGVVLIYLPENQTFVLNSIYYHANHH